MQAACAGTHRDAFAIVLRDVPRIARLCALTVAALLASRGGARADGYASFRLGVEPIGLEASADTPVVGDHVEDAVTAYNAAVTAYNRAHGFPAGSMMASKPIDRSALGLHTTLVTFAPGFEVGGEHVRFRLEGLARVSD